MENGKNSCNNGSDQIQEAKKAKRAWVKPKVEIQEASKVTGSGGNNNIDNNSYS
ncbi:MAG: hypothetical protein HW390_3600 [Candidatus Brocadiaceae bacterium]|nr:hypothetical protein [Candidatus Brocadiaceae bacterium]